MDLLARPIGVEQFASWRDLYRQEMNCQIIHDSIHSRPGWTVDIYMKVGQDFRRRGFGSYLVQELKRVCYDGGSVPAARCNPNNVASRKTLLKAGFVPCGHILTGSLEN